MTREVILKKAIRKSMENGWLFEGYDFDKGWEEYSWIEETRNIIFSHNFAKAFWKPQDCQCECHKHHGILREEHSPFESCCKCASWEYHLQTMVLEEDPILYLERFL